MKKRSLIIIIASAMFVAMLSLGTVFKPDVEFSENENRFLQKAPELSLETVANGRFESKFETYLSDQIIGRESWVKTKGLTEAALGIHDMNGVYLCKGGRAVERTTEVDFDWEGFGRNINQIKELSDALSADGIPVYTMLIPTSAYIYKDELPRNAMVFDEDKAFLQLENQLDKGVIDLREVMQKSIERRNVFFKTDHHWTGFGAFLGYKEFIAKYYGDKSLKGISYEETHPEKLCNDFKGSLYSKVLINTLGTDTIETPALGLNLDYRVTIEGKEYNSLYFKKYLEKKDKYSVFFGGNYDQVDIETSSPKDQNLLIIKDSFANSLVPFLLNDFRKITMIDTRFYRGNVSELSKEYDGVLVIYSINKFAEEKLSLSDSLI